MGGERREGLGASTSPFFPALASLQYFRDLTLAWTFGNSPGSGLQDQTLGCICSLGPPDCRHGSSP